MNKVYKKCQSCAMPINKSSRGTEQDGSFSPMYCIYCYHNGQFTNDCTAEEMRNFVIDILHHKIKFPMFLAKWMTRNIPKLKRWQKQ